MRTDQQCVSRSVEPVRTGELVVQEGNFKGRFENVVFEYQMPAGKAARTRSDFPVAFEEKALHLIAVLRDLEAERNFELIRYDLRIPQTGNC